VDEVFAAAQAARRGGRGVYVLVTEVHGHTPQVVGARMFVHEDGAIVGTIGGGAVEREVIVRALQCLEGGGPRKASFKLKSELGMCCGGSMEVYMEAITAAPRVWIFGAGHVARPTAALASQVGFVVTVVDARPAWNSPERFPDVARVVSDPVAHLGAVGSFDQHDHIVICTHDHEVDKALLRRAVQTGAGYVGMIGSTRKVRTAWRGLELEGIASERIAQVHAPIGLDLYAETPEEIAVSIVAELIRHRREPASRKQTRGAAVEAMRDRLRP
jgi:xanthine dehydrogenase accessory factor